MQNLNVVVLEGNLTKDPDVRTVGANNTAVCDMRIAVNDRVKKNGEWTDAAYYFDVTAWGSTAENCGKYLERGQRISVKGTLRWQEWQADDGTKRQKVYVNADLISFGQKPGGGRGGDSSGSSAGSSGSSGSGRMPAADDDDIPF